MQVAVPYQPQAAVSGASYGRGFKAFATVLTLVLLVYGGPEGSYVVVRYKEGAQVDPPEWYVRENTPPNC